MKRLSNRPSSFLFSLVVFCFFLPFVTFSCAGSEMHLSGMNTAFGKTVEVSSFFGEVEEQEVEGSGKAKIVLLLAVLGLVFSFQASRSGFARTLTCGTLGALLLLLLKMDIEDEALREAGGMIQVSFDFGFWFALLSCVAVAGYSLYAINRLGLTEVSPQDSPEPHLRQAHDS